MQTWDEQELDVTKLKYVLYARKSTDDPERQVRSIDDQIAECQQLAARLGIRIKDKDILTENRSAKRPGQRPVFTKMLKDLRAGVYDAVLSWAPDRLARNMREGGEVIDMIDEAQIKDLKFVTYHFSPDPNGKMLLGMAFVLSKQYSDKLSQDVMRGVRRRFKLEGKTPTPKYGYINREGLYYPDGANFTLIGEAWQRRRQNVSLKEIMVYLTKQGFHRLTKDERKLLITQQKLSKLFADPFYYGVLVQAGQEVDLRQLTGYDFQPAVSEEDFFYVQRHSRVSYFHTKKRIGFYPLKGMLFCAFCGRSMVVAPSTSGTKAKRYLYCRCDDPVCTAEKRRKKRSCRMKIVFDFAYEVLREGLGLTEAEYTKYYEGLKRLSEEEQREKRVELHRMRGMRSRVDSDLTDLVGKLPSGKLSPAQEIAKKKIEEQMLKLNSEAEGLDRDITTIQRELSDPEKVKLSLQEFLNLSKTAAAKLEAADSVGKDTICRLIFLNFQVGDDEVTDDGLREPFASLLRDRKPPKGGSGRGGRIRTGDLLLPKQTRYHCATPRSEIQ